MMDAPLRFLLLLTGLGLSVLGSEIIKGHKVPDNEMLYMASVQNASGHHVCGGFLISKDTVVTAAHCDNGKPMSVVLGTHNLNRTSKRMRFSVKKCKHQRFTDPINGNDIMLLKLSKKVRLYNRLKVVKLPKTEMKIKDNDKCWVAGWGFTKSRGELVSELQSVDVRSVNLETCRKKWRSIKNTILPDTVICAGGSSEDGKGFCQGDSGGPLVCNKIAVGIVSFNFRYRCDYPNLPNIYTNLSKYLHWINETRRKRKC